MKGSHYILVSLLIVASFLFGGALAYSNNKANENSFFIDTINSMNGFDIEKEKSKRLSVEEFGKKQLYLERVGLSITEERSILAVMLISVFIYCLVCWLAIRERLKVGPNNVQVPLIFTSILLATSFISQSFYLSVP